MNLKHTHPVRAHIYYNDGSIFSSERFNFRMYIRNEEVEKFIFSAVATSESVDKLEQLTMHVHYTARMAIRHAKEANRRRENKRAS